MSAERRRDLPRPIQGSARRSGVMSLASCGTDLSPSSVRCDRWFARGHVPVCALPKGYPAPAAKWREREEWLAPQSGRDPVAVGEAVRETVAGAGSSQERKNGSTFVDATGHSSAAALGVGNG